MAFVSGLPIFQAPMAGGITTPKLVSAVSNSGAVGSFGFAYSSKKKIEKDLTEVRKLTNNPVNANFFIFPKNITLSSKKCASANKTLNKLPLCSKHSFTESPSTYVPILEQQLEPIWIHKPKYLTFHFGLPPKHVLKKAHSLGIKVGITATCEKDANKIQAHGADFIVAQGIEAGGHRGTFNKSSKGDEKLSVRQLLRVLKKNIKIPVICAGGIMNGEDIASVLNEGAVAVQMGTAFLCCDEAGTNSTYKNYILEKKKRRTVYTRGFSGRWARCLENEFTSLMHGKFVLPFPLQFNLTTTLRNFAVDTRNGEYQTFYAGEYFQKARALPAAKLINRLAQEMKI